MKIIKTTRHIIHVKIGRRDYLRIRWGNVIQWVQLEGQRIWDASNCFQKQLESEYQALLKAESEVE